MNILFAGSPEIAVDSLRLLHREATVCGVLTSPDKPSGRGKKIIPTPVKTAAHELGIPVIQPGRLNKDARDQVAALKPDLLAVFAYSKIFGPKFLSLFQSGAVNVHPSLLPKYRGPAPIPAAILSGDSKTGVTVQCIGLEMDAGDILLQEEVEIRDGETAGELSQRIAPIGAELLAKTLRLIEKGEAKPVPQEHEEAVYCSMIQKTDGRINWGDEAIVIARQVRAYNPWPMAFTRYKDLKLDIRRARPYDRVTSRDADAIPGKVVGVDKEIGILIQTSEGILAVEELQLQSRKPLDWRAFLNGTPGFTGSQLGGE